MAAGSQGQDREGVVALRYDSLPVLEEEKSTS